MFTGLVCGGDEQAPVTNGDTWVTEKCLPVSCARSHRTFHFTPVPCLCRVAGVHTKSEGNIFYLSWMFGLLGDGNDDDDNGAQ